MDAWAKRNLNRAENPTGFYEEDTKVCAANAGLRAGGPLKARKPRKAWVGAASLRAVAGRSEGTPHCDLVERHRQRGLITQKLNGESLKNFAKSQQSFAFAFCFTPGLTTKIRRRRAGCETLKQCTHGGRLDCVVRLRCREEPGPTKAATKVERTAWMHGQSLP